MINSKQIFFLFLINFLFIYFLAGIVVFYLNNYNFFSLGDLTVIGEYYNLKWTYNAVLNDVPRIYDALLFTSIFSTPIIAIIPFLPKSRSLHGNARFATFAEIKNKFKLLSEKGIIVGKTKGKKERYFSEPWITTLTNKYKK